MNELKQQFGKQFEPALIEEMNRVGTFMELDEGKDLIRPGQYIKSMPLLLSGSIKILRPDDDGEELLLYHLEKGDTCAMTLTYGLETTKSEIHAVTETPVKLLMIPLGKGEEWAGKYKSWRTFVFSSYHERMMEMLESIDNIAFNNMDERLQKFLESKIEVLHSKHIYMTHKEIAADLHTSRVVVSRLLKKMENDGKIKLHRSFIEVQ
ncbi:Crp/Fnr family transcriptional regulator [Gangjinia marincola]|uniref:Crp/Fnr family transcriptional regulator n=1 Tax=Gangjinia marincola TaxID=578463 RepID=A0ABN1MKK8_9FLAO